MLALALALALGVAMTPQDPADPMIAARAAVVAAEQQHGADSIEVAEALVRLFNQLSARGAIDESLAVARRALAIREVRLPPGHQRIGVALSNVAAVLVRKHDPAAALPLFARARGILQETPPSRAMLGVLVNLGVCHSLLGDYAAARELLEEGVAYGRRHAPDHPLLAQALQNFASVLLRLGEVERARALVQETVEVLAKAEPNGARHGHSLLGLGYVLLQAGRFDDAEPLLRRSMEIGAQMANGGGQWVGAAASSLAWIHRVRGDLVQARRLAEQALLASPGLPPFERSFRVATLARVMEAQGEVGPAVALMTRTLAEARDAGAADAQVYTLLVTAGDLLLRDGRHAEALVPLREALAVGKALGIEFASTMYEARTALARCQHALGDVGGACRALVTNLDGFGTMLERMLPALSETGRLETVAHDRKDLELLLAWTAERPETMTPAEVYAHVLAWKGQVARGILETQTAARQDEQGLARMRRLQEIVSDVTIGRADAGTLAERERLVAALDAGVRPPAAPAVAELRAALPPDAALVDVLLVRRADGARYEAFVVTREVVRRVDLGPSDAMAQAIASHLEVVARSDRPGASQVGAAVGRAARARAWEPLLPALGGKTRILISPDAQLATLPFETLPGDEPGTFLLEQFAISYLCDAADLMRAAMPPGKVHLLALGEIAYGGPPAPSASARGVPRPFAPLPATARELEVLATLAPEIECELVRGEQATEAMLRERAGAATHVHLATHGFYGLDQQPGAIRAGVALAGANDAPGKDDGIVTVEEAALLDLRACRLVVLSACQTGLGKPFAGESLLGLRRALRIAGARTTVTSLWRVDDDATAALMTEFYRDLFGADRAPAAALRAAQLRALARNRQASGEGLPGTWGAFVSEGGL